MAIDLEERVTFLSQIYLCHGFSKEQVNLLANNLEEVVYPAGSHITTQGEASNMLFLIWSGKAKITQADISSPEAILSEGDYFGEETIIKKEWPWHATIIAVDEVQVFVLKLNQFELLRNKIPRFVSNIQIVIKGHLRAQKAHFKWLPGDETIHFI
jgi:CRP-like cAMP-binding protein